MVAHLKTRLCDSQKWRRYIWGDNPQHLAYSVTKQTERVRKRGCQQNALYTHLIHHVNSKDCVNYICVAAQPWIFCRGLCRMPGWDDATNFKKQLLWQNLGFEIRRECALIILPTYVRTYFQHACNRQSVSHQLYFVVTAQVHSTKDCMCPLK